MNNVSSTERVPSAAAPPACLGGGALPRGGAHASLRGAPAPLGLRGAGEPPGFRPPFRPEERELGFPTGLEGARDEPRNLGGCFGDGNAGLLEPRHLLLRGDRKSV